MANSKLTNSLRSSIAAETKSLEERPIGTAPNHATTITKPDRTTPVAKPAVAAKNKVTKSPAKRTATNAAKKVVVPAKSAVITSEKKTTAKAQTKRSNKNRAMAKTLTHKPINHLNKASSAKIPSQTESFAASLVHNKLHHMIETHHHLCETCLENLQKVNDNLHSYFNQLAKVNNLSALVKLNLSYLSSAPTRFQEMVAQNKNIFSDFFKFAKPEEK